MFFRAFPILRFDPFCICTLKQSCLSCICAAVAASSSLSDMVKWSAAGRWLMLRVGAHLDTSAVFYHKMPVLSRLPVGETWVMVTGPDGPPGCGPTTSLAPPGASDLGISTTDDMDSKNSVLPGYSIVYKAPLVSHVKVTALKCFCVKDQPWFLLRSACSWSRFPHWGPGLCFNKQRHPTDGGILYYVYLSRLFARHCVGKGQQSPLDPFFCQFHWFKAKDIVDGCTVCSLGLIAAQTWEDFDLQGKITCTCSVLAYTSG